MLAKCLPDACCHPRQYSSVKRSVYSYCMARVRVAQNLSTHMSVGEGNVEACTTHLTEIWRPPFCAFCCIVETAQLTPTANVMQGLHRTFQKRDHAWKVAVKTMSQSVSGFFCVQSVSELLVQWQEVKWCGECSERATTLCTYLKSRSGYTEWKNTCSN
jgi:hypothetical protein